MNYNEALDYLDPLGTFGIKPGLQRIQLLLDCLDNPEKKVKFVHVTGTNGKGSVTSMLNSIFLKANLKTGSFTSPHLVKWNERININGQNISDQQLATAISKVKIVADLVAEKLEQPTQFEIITAVAFYLFAEAKLDIAVIEVGMGGLLDSTNVIMPECTIITNVHIDHVDKFGSRLLDIAKQKAGIIKRNIPVVTATQKDALAYIEKVASDLQAPIFILDQDFTISLGDGTINQQKFSFCLTDKKGDYTVNLGGNHQANNASLAIMTAKLLHVKFPTITEDAIKEGLLSVEWAGRLERVSQKPDIILDGAHNLASALVLREALDKYYPNQAICFVIGIMQDKDMQEIIKILVKPQDTLIATIADETERAARPEQIVQLSSGINFVEYDLSTAMEHARKITGASGIVCCAGSLYLIGRLKTLNI